MSGAVPNAMAFDSVKTAIGSDKTLPKAIEHVHTSSWHEMKNVNYGKIYVLELQAMLAVRDELVLYGDRILLQDGRIVLAKSLRDRAINIAHGVIKLFVAQKHPCVPKFGSWV